MIITVNTEHPISAVDQAVLRALLSDPWPAAPAAPEEKAEEKSDYDKAVDARVKAQAEPAKAPAKRTRKAPAKVVEEPTPEPEAAPSAPTAPAAESADEEATDGPSLEDAISLATKLVSEGKRPKVKEALASIGVGRVSQLKPEQVQAFIDAVGEEDVL